MRCAGKASGTLRGAGADPARATALYGPVLAAGELLVPLPGRGTRVLELAALADRGRGRRGTGRLGGPARHRVLLPLRPAATWLDAPDEHAEHLLLADEAAGARPPPRFSAAARPTTREWLAVHAWPGPVHFPRPAGVRSLSRTSPPRPGGRSDRRGGRVGWWPAGAGTGCSWPRNC